MQATSSIFKSLKSVQQICVLILLIIHVTLLQFQDPLFPVSPPQKIASLTTYA